MACSQDITRSYHKMPLSRDDASYNAFPFATSFTSSMPTSLYPPPSPSLYTPFTYASLPYTLHTPSIYAPSLPYDTHILRTAMQEFPHTQMQASNKESLQTSSSTSSQKSSQSLKKTSREQESITSYNSDNQKIFELLADSIHSANHIIHAIGDAIFLSKDFYLLADNIHYHIDTRQVQAMGHVRIYRGENLIVTSEQVDIALDEKLSIISPLYLQDTQSGLWISASQASMHDTSYAFKQSTLSSCAIPNPIWRMEASSGAYSSSSSRVSLWNPRVYVGDVPILYLPYFNFSTDTSRTSGLLLPTFITSNIEGFAFFQPIYLAPKNNWDITLTPQIRTARGYGGLVEFRALDSALDRTYAELGYLYNFDEYINTYNIKNHYIYGTRLYHLGNRPLQKYFNIQSPIDNGIYINFVSMNDLDYYRIRAINKRVYDTTYTSKANAYIQNSKHYLGLNLKYFLNLAKLDNQTTFQSLPNIQYHKYLDAFFLRNLMYSLDYQFKNTARPVGYGYIENSMRFPMGLQFSFLNKYVSLSVWNELYAENLFLTKTQNSFIPLNDNTNQNGNIFSANYSIALNTDISKSYNKFFHTIQLEALLNGPYLFYHNGLLSQETGEESARIRQDSLALREQSYTQASYLNKFPILTANGVHFYDDIWNPSLINAYSEINQTLDLKLSQYFLTNAGRSILDWKIFQRINLDELRDVLANEEPNTRAIVKRPLENKLSFSPMMGLNLSTSFFYSFYTEKFSEFALNTSINRGYFSAASSFFFRDKEAFDYLSNLFTTQTSARYVSGNIAHDFRIFSFSASASYDLEKNVLLSWNTTFSKHIRCFNFSLTFVNRRVPILINNLTNPFYIQQDYYVQLLVNFLPLTSTTFTTRF